MATTVGVAKRQMSNRKKELLADIKCDVKESHKYFDTNYQRFNRWRKFVYESTLSDSDVNTLKDLGLPQLEFNVVEPFANRLCGEFSKQEPSLAVSAADDAKNVDPKIIDFLEGHFRAIIYNSNRDNLSYHLFRDIVSGGFSAAKVYTDYLHAMSFDQRIVYERVYDPTMCGWDPMSKLSHKGDGNYCFELYPKTREEFEATYGKEYTQGMSFMREIGGFNWSYNSDGKDFVLMGDYYKKTKKKVKIVQLVTGDVVEADKYEQKLEEWNSDPSRLIQAPGVIGKSRTSEMTYIDHYIITECDIIEEEKTDWNHLPIVFFDGNSIELRDNQSGCISQMTRPMLYNAEGIQKLKNISGIYLANDIENTAQAKLIVAKESIPAEYSDAYTDYQHPSVVVYNSLNPQDPTQPLPAPIPFPRMPAPPEITNAFQMSDEMTMTILGSYDGMMKENQASGRAISNSAIQMNATFLPQIVGYMSGLNQVLNIFLDLIPKYILQPRQMPIRDRKGKDTMIPVNQEGGINLDYDSNSMSIKVEASVSFEIQRQQAMQTLLGLMKDVPVIGQFVSTTQEGVEMLLDNIDIRGIDTLKEGIKPFLEEMKKSQAQNNPMVIKQKELQIKAQKNQSDAQIDIARISVEQQSAETDRMIAEASIGQKQSESEIKAAQVQAENARTAVDYAISHTDRDHSRAMDMLSLHHENERHNRKIQADEAKPKSNKKKEV